MTTEQHQALARESVREVADAEPAGKLNPTELLARIEALETRLAHDPALDERFLAELEPETPIPDLQTDRPDFRHVHRRVLDYLRRSKDAGRPWVVACDEPGDATHSLRPDDDAGNSHEDGRKNALWGTLLAGGAGNEWYFGYAHSHSDVTLDDFRSRDKWWDVCRYALEFFGDNKIPFCLACGGCWAVRRGGS